MKATDWKAGDQISTELILIERVQSGEKVKSDDGSEVEIDNARGWFWWAHVKGTDPKHRLLVHMEFCEKKPEVQEFKDHFKVKHSTETAQYKEPKTWLSSSNPPAFPCDLNHQLPGMQLRDYFAAKAMEGWLASFGEDAPHPARNHDAVDVMRETARCSYALADAMIEARGKQ